jgi:hypothetical protein
LPAGAREFPIRDFVGDREASAELERVRDLAMPDVHSLETLRQGAVPPVDINATIVTKQDSLPAQILRDRALDVRIDLDQLETIRRPVGSEIAHPVDVNATIVTNRARTVAEQERDLAFEKLRDGTADELRREKKPHASTGSEASGQPVRQRGTDGLPLLKTHAVEIRGARTRPDEDSGITARATGNELRGTINRPNHHDGPALDATEHALVGKLRALPPQGREPDWTALEASILAEVRGRPVVRPWWQRWFYLAPVGALAAAAGVLLVLGNSSERVPRQATLTAPREQAPRESAAGATMWLDGEAFDLDAIDWTALDEMVPAPEVDDAAREGARDDGVLPATDYSWLDALDADGLARAESWLARTGS